MSGASALRFVTGRSIAEVLYAKGTIVVCRHCGKPLYRLQASIFVGERAGSSAWKYAPVTMADLADLMDRSDVEAGHRAIVGAMSIEDRRFHCDRIPPLRANAMADCPSCLQPFVFGHIADDSDGGARFGDDAEFGGDGGALRVSLKEGDGEGSLEGGVEGYG